MTEHSSDQLIYNDAKTGARVQIPFGNGVARRLYVSLGELYEPQRVKLNQGNIQTPREFVASVVARLHHVETHWVPEGRAVPQPYAETMEIWDQVLGAHDAQVKTEAWDEGYAQAIRDYSPEYDGSDDTPNPYREEE